VAAVITPTNPCVQIDVEPGAWILAAEPIDPSGDQAERFEVSFANS